MNTVNVHFVVHIIMMLCVGKYSETKAQDHYPSYGYQPDGYLYHLKNVQSDDVTSTRDLPTTYKPPLFGSQDFWTALAAGRRTFTDDFGYFHPDKSTPAENGFFDFMKPLFDKTTAFKPLPPSVPPKPITEPYKYEYPYEFLSEPNFLPPPKPLRASIVKLETVTGHPNIPFKNVSKESTLHIDELGFHTEDVIRGDASLIHQTTSSEEDFRTSQFGSKLHVLVDDNYSTLDSGVLEQVTTPPRGLSNTGQVEETKKITETTTKEPQLVLTSILNVVDAANDTKANSNHTARDIALDQQKKTDSIKIVTDLTLQGLAKNKNQMANIPKYTKLLNMTSLIDYELSKLKRNKHLKEKLYKMDEDMSEGGVSFAKPSSDDDDLSLDLKILKDTNWDGFTTPATGNGSTIKAQVDDNERSGTVAARRIEESENGTIIVETRVTKSVSKAKPKTSSRDIKKLIEKMNNETRITDDDNDKDLPVSQRSSAEELLVVNEKPKKLLSETKRSRSSYRSRRRKYRPHARNTTEKNSSIADATGVEITSRNAKLHTTFDTDQGNRSSVLGAEVSNVNATNATPVHTRKHRRRSKSKSKQNKRQSDANADA